jgi:hypothetical protein
LLFTGVAQQTPQQQPPQGASPPPPNTENQVVALVNDEVITFKDVLDEWAFDRMLNASLTQYPPDSKIQELRQRLVADRLWVDHAKRIERLQPFLVKEEFRRHAGNQYGEMWEQADDETRAILLRKAEAHFCTLAILQTAPQFQRMSAMRPADLRAYYQRNQEKFHSTERVHLGRVTIPRSIHGNDAEDLAQSIRQRALELGDLEAATKELAPGSYKDDGWKETRSSGLREEILEFARTAVHGEFSGLVRTPRTVFLYSLLERQEDRTLSFQEATPLIKRELEARRRAAVIEHYFVSRVLPEAYFQPADLFEITRE